MITDKKNLEINDNYCVDVLDAIMHWNILNYGDEKGSCLQDFITINGVLSQLIIVISDKANSNQYIIT